MALILIMEVINKYIYEISTNLKQNEALSAHAQSTHKGVN